MLPGPFKFCLNFAYPLTSSKKNASDPDSEDYSGTEPAHTSQIESGHPSTRMGQSVESDPDAILELKVSVVQVRGIPLLPDEGAPSPPSRSNR